jgi:hypothetical protein
MHPIWYIALPCLLKLAVDLLLRNDKPAWRD